LRACGEEKLTKGVAIEKPQESQRMKTSVFMFWDPGGYIVEMRQSLTRALSL
jgi:hypothetical protein